MPYRLVCCALALLTACSKPSAPEASAGLGAPAQSARGALVARVGKAALYEDDVERAVKRDPGASSARFEAPGARRELIDGLVRFELLAQAAERAGLTRDPDALHALQQIAVTKLVNQTLGAAAAPDSVTPQDVEREYAARQATEFTLPEAAHVRHIRVADSRLAERLATRARALAPDDDRGFAALASASTEDTATRSSGGDLGFVDETSKLPNALVRAALTLKAPGEIVGPFETELGREIVRLVSRRAAAVSPLSSVAEPIRQRLYRERRAKALDDYIARLRSETPVEIVEPKVTAQR
jgi:peptidyl-prolyl cis-trans isomerase C